MKGQKGWEETTGIVWGRGRASGIVGGFEKVEVGMIETRTD